MTGDSKPKAPDSDIRRLGDIEIDLVAVQKLLTFLIAMIFAGVAAVVINNAAINDGISTQMAFQYAFGGFFGLLLIFYGLIYVVIRRRGDTQT